MKSLIRVEKLIDLFPLKGRRLLGYNSKHPEGTDYEIFVLRLSSDEQEYVDIKFTLPMADDKGVIKVGQTYRTVIHTAKRGALYNLKKNSIAGTWVSTPEDNVKWMLRDALQLSITKEDEDIALLQDRIDSFFASGDCVRFVSPDKEVDIEQTVDTLHLDVVENSVDYKEREFDDWEGSIDIITTSQGRYAGLVYRMADGATVDKYRLKSSTNLFSRTMRKYLVFPENDRPDRLLMSRPVFAKHECLVDSEDPYVAHRDYDGALTGKHLMTAIMSHPLNYYDSITMIDKSAIKMDCTKITRQVFVTSKPYELVFEGTDLYKNDVLLRYKDDSVLADQMVYNRGRLLRYEREGTMVGQVPATRHTFVIEQFYPMTSGDKLSSRHSSKGVVSIARNISKEHLDQITTTAGIVPDVIIHPRSLVGRRNLGVLREMMANWKCIKEGTVFRTEHFSDKWSMQQLVDEGYGEYSTTIGGGHCFIGPLYWLRVDKHACDQYSVVGKHKPLSIHGTNPDSGIGGQRLGPDSLVVMKAKGMDHILNRMTSEEVEQGALDRAKSLFKALSMTIGAADGND